MTTAIIILMCGCRVEKTSKGRSSDTLDTIFARQNYDGNPQFVVVSKLIDERYRVKITSSRLVVLHAESMGAVADILSSLGSDYAVFNGLKNSETGESSLSANEVDLLRSQVDRVNSSP